MDLHLDGRTALVSGSTGGIGFALAGGLAQMGATVIVNGRSAERVAPHGAGNRRVGIFSHGASEVYNQVFRDRRGSG